MKFATKLALPFAAAMMVSFGQANAADLDPVEPEKAHHDCTDYPRVAVSMAINTSKAAILQHSRFYQANRFRSTIGPHHYAIYYDPDHVCADAPRKKKR